MNTGVAALDRLLERAHWNTERPHDVRGLRTAGRARRRGTHRRVSTRGQQHHPAADRHSHQTRPLPHINPRHGFRDRCTLSSCLASSRSRIGAGKKRDGRHSRAVLRFSALRQPSLARGSTRGCGNTYRRRRSEAFCKLEFVNGGYVARRRVSRHGAHAADSTGGAAGDGGGPAPAGPGLAPSSAAWRTARSGFRLLTNRGEPWTPFGE